MAITFYTNPAEFLADAEAFLASCPLDCAIIANTARRGVERGVPEDRPFWFAVAQQDGEIVGIVMRTHPSPPHAGYVTTMPEQAVLVLAEALAARGEIVAAWNGDKDAGHLLCAAASPVSEVEVNVHLRLWEAPSITMPIRPEAGEMRLAALDDVPLVTQWVKDFTRAAAEQGGRVEAHETLRDDDEIRADTEAGKYWLWDTGTEITSLVGLHPPNADVVMIGPAYTPTEYRGRGYAGWMIAAGAQRALDQGLRPALYTDQANPVSNKLYASLGFLPVHDEAEQIAIFPADDCSSRRD